MLFSVKLRDRGPQSNRGRSKQYQRVFEGVMVEVIFEAILKELELLGNRKMCMGPRKHFREL